MKSKTPRPFTGNPQPKVKPESVGGDAYAIALALDKSPRASAITMQALDSLPVNHRRQAKRQIAALGVDGWFNPDNLMGMAGGDPGEGMDYAPSRPIDFFKLESIYRGEGLGRKLIDIPIHQMFRREMSLKGESDNRTFKFLKRKRVIADLEKLAKNGDLFGGALGVSLVDDGQPDLSIPLDLKKVERYLGLNVFDRWQVAWYTDNLYRNPENPKFMMPRRYQIFPIYGAPFWVHESRVIRWDGNFIPERSRQLNMGWHDSVLNAVISKLKAFGEAFGISKDVMRTLVIQVLSMDGLGQLIKDGQKGMVQERFRNLRSWLRVGNILPLDGKDTYSKNSSSIQGVASLLDRFMQWLAAEGPVPFSILFGKLSGSLGGGKDDDVQLRMFYDDIAHKRANKAGDCLNRIIEIVHASQDGPYNGKPPKEFEITFPALTEPTEAEQATTRLAVAQADHIYMEDGVFSPEDIRQMRAGGDTYSADYKISGDVKRAPGVPDPVKPVTKPAEPKED